MKILLVSLSIPLLVSCASVTATLNYDDNKGTQINITASKVDPQSEIVQQILDFMSKKEN